MNTRSNYFLKVTLAFALSLIITFLLMMPAISKATPDALLQDKEPYRVESFDLSGAGSLDVQTSGGHITVEGSSDNTVRVEMYVKKDGKNLLPEDTELSDWDIEIAQSGQKVKAIAKRDNNGWNIFSSSNHPSISFVVYTPNEMTSNLTTSGGHIRMRGLSGEQEVKTSGGHIKLADIKGNIDAHTSGGKITLNNLEGNVEARTSGGHMRAEDIEGNITLRTSGGHITLKNVGGAIEAKTSGGHITADLSSIHKYANLSTSGGNISINVPAGTGLDLNLRGNYVQSNLDNFSGEADRNEIEGQVNGGGAKISARTSGGTVSLSFK